MAADERGSTRIENTNLIGVHLRSSAAQNGLFIAFKGAVGQVIP
jgi:hypothetical protein